MRQSFLIILVLNCLHTTFLYNVGKAQVSLKPPAADSKEENESSQLISIAESYLHHSPDSAFTYAKKAQEIALKHGHARQIAQSYHISGKIFYQKGVFNRAISELLKALKIYRQIQDKKGQAQTLQDLGLAYQYTQKSEPQLALETFQKALTLFSDLKDKKGIAGTFSNIGHVYEKIPERPKALEYQQKALAIYEQTDDKAGLAKVLDDIGSLYEDWEDYDKAYLYFSKALTYNLETNHQVEAIIDLNNIGDIFQKQGKLQESLTYFFRSLELARQLKQHYQLRSVYRDLAQTYFLMKEYAKAYAYLDSSYVKYGEVYNADIANQIAGMQVIYETQEKEKEIALLENKHYFNTLLLYFFTAGILVLLILGSIIMNRQRLLLSKNKKIMEQHELLYNKERQLQQTSLENLKLKEQKLQDELSLRNRELTGRTLTIVQKNKILGEILEKIHIALQKKDQDREKELKQLLKLIEQNAQANQDWQEFQQGFEQIHGEFFTRLGEAFPELTSGDLRLCALIRLNMSTKDIASTLGISQDSLRVNRHRLRKKLRLQQGDNITHFIMTV